MQDDVKNYYGKILTNSDDLQTNACCTDDNLPTFVKNALSKIHKEVLTRYYGCGLVAPEELKGCRILDLGSGSGRDCYALAQLVGEQGSVLGIDMTDEQLNIANQYIDYHRETFAYKESNVSFKKGYIEKLDELDLENEYFDIIISNCVINLSTDKEAVLKQAYRLLKPGGEMYFSDVYSDKRVPENLTKDPLLYGECLSGALYINDFLSLARSVGFNDPRMVENRPITIGNPKIINRVAGINFSSITYRLFKSPDLEAYQEDYGQAVVYQGGIENSKQYFKLDSKHVFVRGKAACVSGNTWRILQQSRFASHFLFVGDFQQHYGAFDGSNHEPNLVSRANEQTDLDADSTEQNKGCC